MILRISRDAGVSYRDGPKGTLEELKAYIVAHPEMDSLRWFILGDDGVQIDDLCCPTVAALINAIAPEMNVKAFPERKP